MNRYKEAEIYTLLINNEEIACSGMNVELFKKFNIETDMIEIIFKKIKKINEYYESNNNKYSNKIMEYLRQRDGLDKYDISMDEQLNQLTPNEVFREVCHWNGLVSYDYTIKSWIKDIYGISLGEGDIDLE